MIPTSNQVYAGVPTTFSLLNPSAQGQAYYSFATTLQGLATSSANAGTANVSTAYTFTSPNTAYTVWGRIFDSSGNYTTYAYTFTSASLTTNNGFAINGPGLVEPNTTATTFPYTLTLINNGNVPTSQWVVYWGDGTVSQYDVSPTSTAPITETHYYSTASSIYQINANVVDDSNNLTTLSPISLTVVGTGNGPLLAPPTNVRVQQSGSYSLNISWTNPAAGPEGGPQTPTGYNLEFSQDGIHWTSFDPVAYTGTSSVSRENPFGSKVYVRMQMIYDYTDNSGVYHEDDTAFSNVVSEDWADQDAIVEVSANVQSSPTAAINLTWPVDNDPAAYGYLVERRVAGTTTWTPLNTMALDATSTGYTDTNVTPGVEYQYLVTRLQTYSPIAQGLIDAGIDLATSDTQGTIELIVDDNSTFSSMIAPTLAQFEQTLIGAGWAINLHYVSESDSPATIHNLIQTDYDNDPSGVKQVLLIGDVQTPLSVAIAPDGHSNDPRNFPMDAYYGDVDGSWDPDIIGPPTLVNGVELYGGELLGPSAIQLGVGRIDFAGFLDPNNNADVNATRDIAFEAQLTEQYLDRDIAFRTGLFNVQDRAITDVNFGGLGDIAYQNLGPLVGSSNIQTLPTNEYFLQNPGVNPATGATLEDDISLPGALWAYADGGGGLGHSDGVGTSSDFFDPSAAVNLESESAPHGPATSVFNYMTGSFYGQWNANNPADGTNNNFVNNPNFLVSPLSGIPSSDTLFQEELADPFNPSDPNSLASNNYNGYGLTDVWGLGTFWNFQQMALGGTIGQSIAYSQDGGFDNTPGNIGVYENLMGDPTLTQDIVGPVSNLAATTNTNGSVTLNWMPPPA